MKLNLEHVNKFNQKVRKANLHPKRKRRSKSKANEEKKADKSESRNSSLKRLKNRVSKRIGQSHLQLEKDHGSDDGKNYDPK